MSTYDQNEILRIKELRSFGILDTSPEPHFDRFIQMVSNRMGFPVAILNLVDEDRWWFKASVGLDVREIWRGRGCCCDRVVRDKLPLRMNDLKYDEASSNQSLEIGSRLLRAYLGVPLLTSNGYAIGSLCLMDSKPRELNNEQVQELEEFAELAMQLIEAHRLKERFHQEQKLESIGRLADGVAHEFNNLLAGIFISTDLAKDRVDDENPELSEYLNNIQKSAEGAARLTRQLLGFARKGKYKVESLNVNAFLNEIILLIRGTAKPHHQIESRFHTDGITVDADRGQLQAALLDVALNGLDDMPGNGVLTLESFEVTIEKLDPLVQTHQLEEGSYVQVLVTDTGTVKGDETLSGIFDPYFVKKPNAERAGMGLASAYGTLRNHGGLITAAGKAERGNQISIYLPHSGRVLEAPSVKSVQKAKFKGRALLVEDEYLVRKLNTRLLEAMGFEVIAESSGESAVDRLHERGQSFDLLMLDIVLPGRDGLSVYYASRSLQPEAKVLFTSGNAPEEEVQAVLTYEGVEFIEKPFTRQVLEEELRTLLLAVPS